VLVLATIPPCDEFFEDCFVLDDSQLSCGGRCENAFVNCYGS